MSTPMRMCRNSWYTTKSRQSSGTSGESNAGDMEMTLNME